MKRALLAATAILSSNMIQSAAMAATIGTATVEDPVAQGLNSANMIAAQAQCTALAAAHAPLVYTGTLDEGSIVPTLVSGPTEIDPSARVKSNIVGTGTFTPSHTFIVGNPFRIGGSVNMFGDQFADSGSWSDSTYDFTNDFTSTFSYAFNCDMQETVHVPVQGSYVVDPDAPGDSKDAIRANCDAFTALGPDASQPWWGTDHAFCDFVTTVAAHDEQQDRPPEAGTPISQDQTDTLSGHENHGGPVEADGGIFHIGQVVICISPSKPTPGGTWRTQNGYTGNLCTTAYFKIAPFGSGSESSNGTYISVPDYN
jgi:hypothetical protein